MNLPNIITLSRIPLMFVLVGLMYCHWTGAATIAFWLFILGAVGDWFDGYLARKQNLVSTFGKFMDALTDKILVIGLMVAFVEQGAIPVVIALLTIVREFLVSGMRMVAASQGVVVAAERGGKAKTLFQLIAIGFVLAAPMFQVDVSRWTGWNLAEFSQWVHWVGLGLFIIATYLTVQSGIDYMIKYRALMFGPDQQK